MRLAGAFISPIVMVLVRGAPMVVARRRGSFVMAKDHADARRGRRHPLEGNQQRHRENHEQPGLSYSHRRGFYSKDG